MYKTLSPHDLGISGRQSEIIELALTYGFRGLEIDMQEFAKRVQIQGMDRAKRFLESAHLRVSGFELPIKWRGDESVYESELERLDQIASCAAALGVKGCWTLVMPATDMFPYHENFELHRRRLGGMAEALGKHGLRLGVGFLAAPSHREGKSFQFIHEADALVTLLKSVASKNIGLLLDTWDWHFGGGKLDQLKSLGADRIVSVRMAEAPPDVTSGPITDEQRLIPTLTGSVDNGSVIALLHEMGYKGSVSADPLPALFSGMTRDAIVQKCS
ncbi:MAG: sugar phosphate isomerase/epimerase family protein, partial [Pirellulaceae bacterium]